MPTTDFRATLGTPDQALAHLRQEKNITFETFDAIMHFHILEAPGLGALRRNYEERAWHPLSAQLRAFAMFRHEALLALITGNANLENLRREVLTIELLRELSTTAGSMVRDAPEIGN